MAAKNSSKRKPVGTLVGLSDAKINAMEVEEFGNRVMADLRKAKPYLTEKQLDAIESRFCDGTKGVSRRAALLVLLKPGAWLIEHIEKDRDVAVALADVARCGADYASRLRQTADLVDTAAARINVALCVREDFDAVRAEAANG